MANLRVPQAAEYVGLSKSYLDKARMTNTGPAYAKLGATVIYSTDDLDAWVAARRVVPANDNQRAQGVAA
ncbi:MAG: helix-turn-helix domain-containing protein [Rhizobiales bacterium]|nr:helix-turn-helix domain-containing protein [Hyphomicrobiales bacterium]